MGELNIEDLGAPLLLLADKKEFACFHGLTLYENSFNKQ